MRKMPKPKKKTLKEMNRLELELVIEDLELQIGCAKIAIAMAEDSHDVLVQQVEIRRLRKRIEYVERNIFGLDWREKMEQAWAEQVVAGPPPPMAPMRRLRDLDETAWPS